MRRITKRQRKSCESDIESFSLSFGDDVATLGILEGGARREAVGGMKSDLFRRSYSKAFYEARFDEKTAPSFADDTVSRARLSYSLLPTLGVFAVGAMGATFLFDELSAAIGADFTFDDAVGQVVL